MQATQNKAHVTNQAQALTQKYCYECGFNRLPWMSRYFQSQLSSGLSFELLELLIDQTAHAPRPSYAYLSWLIAMCERSGIKDQLDWMIKPKITKDDLPL